jgi:hypothetical protein
MADQFDQSSDSLKSALPLVATPTTEPIVAGGPSSSTRLNALREAILTDIAELDRRTADTSAQISEARTIFAQQVSALTSRFTSLSARLPATSGRWLGDFYTEDFVDGTNGADVNTTYGQATLPIRAVTDKLVGRDSRDQVWIPKGTQIAYSYKSSEPTEVDWIADDNALKVLDGRSDTAWWKDRGASGNIWVRVKLPAQLNANKLANTVILHPFPALSFDLVSLEYQNPAGQWTHADRSYQTGYNATNGRIEWIGNVRFFLPETMVTELRIRLGAGSFWGFTQIAVQQTEFSATADLVCDFTSYNPGTLGAVRVTGKDPGRLVYLTTAINGTQATVSLTQDISNSSPIITGVEVRS